MNFTYFSDVLPLSIPLNRLKNIFIFYFWANRCNSILKTTGRAGGKTEEERWFHTFGTGRTHSAVTPPLCSQSTGTVERTGDLFKGINQR